MSSQDWQQAVLHDLGLGQRGLTTLEPRSAQPPPPAEQAVWPPQPSVPPPPMPASGTGPAGVPPQQTGPQPTAPQQVGPQHTGPQHTGPQHTGPHGTGAHAPEPVGPTAAQPAPAQPPAPAQQGVPAAQDHAAVPPQQPNVAVPGPRPPSDAERHGPGPQAAPSPESQAPQGAPGTGGAEGSGPSPQRPPGLPEIPPLPVDPFGPAPTPPAPPTPPADRAGKSADSLASETAWFRAFSVQPSSAAPPSSQPDQAGDDAEEPAAGAPYGEAPPFQGPPAQAQPGPSAPYPSPPEHGQPLDPNAAWQASSGPAHPTAPTPAPPRTQDHEQKNLHGDPLFRRMSRSVLKAVGGTGAQDLRQLEGLTNRLRVPVSTCRQIAVTSIRGGAGKTTVAALISMALGQHRTDRMLAVDADSGLGSLPLRLGAQADRSLHDLATAYPRSWQEASSYLTQVAERLWVLSGTAHGAVTGELELDTYRTAVGALNRYFSAYIIDCGAGIVTQPQRGILTTVHAQVMVTPATPDGVSSAQSTLQWLQANGYAELLPRTVIALVTHSPHAETDVDRARTALSAGGTPVVHVPYDRHLAAGKAVDFSRIAEDTRTAALRIAAEVLTRASTA